MEPTNYRIWHTNVYEVNLGEYSREGSFTGFLPHLPRLREMGMETLWSGLKKRLPGRPGSFEN
jgi:alpha-amylase